MRRTSWLWLFLIFICLLPLCTAQGETASYSFTENGLRLYLPGDWKVLTLSNLKDHEQEIKSLGTTVDALASSFQSSGTLLEAFPAEGGQINIQLKPLPDGFSAQDAYSMTAEQKDDYLLKMVKAYGLSGGEWSSELPEYAVFRGKATIQSLSVQTITYATVRYGQVFMVSADIIGREPTQADEKALNTAASSILFLGVQKTPPPAVTPAINEAINIQPTPTPAPAVIKVQRDETALTLDYVPSVSNTAKLTITGVTEPNTPMRYYVNGQGYERFTSDSDGRFSCSIRELTKKGKNIVTIYAIGQKGYGVVAFPISLEQEKAPLKVTPMTQGVAGNKAVITGAVLPGCTVQVLYHTKTYDTFVLEDGSFSCEVDLERLGENTFTVRATLAGYLKSEEKLTVIRIRSDLDEQEAFQNKLRPINYDKLYAKPASFKDSKVKYEGRVLSLSGQNGQPLAVISTEGDTHPVAVLCTDLNDLELNQQVVMLCTLNGTMREVTLAGSKQSIPEARLNWLLPNE